MSDDRLDRALSDAITDIAGTSSPNYLNDILERTARTRQRPWWTFPGRYLSVSSTLKFATAASLAFVLGIGLAPLVMPSNPVGGGVPGAAASPSPSPEISDRSPAVVFEGQWEASHQIPSETASRFDAYPTQQYDRLWAFRTVEMSDPRLDGDVVTSNNLHTYSDIGVEVFNAMFRIDNEDGAWVEVPHLGLRLPGDDPTATTTVLVGEGEYAGLVAVMEIDWLSQASGLFDVRGIIIDGDTPPEPATAPAPES